MYKDKDKQREADRERQRRHRAAKSVTKQAKTQSVTSDIMSQSERKNYKPASELKPGELNKVSKPGDADYVPQCETTKAFIEERPKCSLIDRRGKDIKTFLDLPPDVQQTIRDVSDTNEEFEKRTAIAIKYQHLFPNRYHSTGAQ